MELSRNEKIIGICLIVVIVAISSFVILINIPNSTTGNTVLNPKKAICGDSVCDKEEQGICEADCEWCGDGFCEPNENCRICPKDCGKCSETNKCGNGVCEGKECETCFKDCSYIECQNGICEPKKGENCENTPSDCRCKKDHLCKKGICISLACGNGRCESDESCISCPEDCGICDCAETYGGVICKDGQNCNGNLIATSCCIGICSYEGNYPLIFVHGHSPNEVGGMYSIDAFRDFQNKLVNDGLYLDKGVILANYELDDFNEDQWANTEIPLSFRTTYYYGEYSEKGGFTYDDNNQDIETYAKRLGKVVEIVKKATGREKVDIVAHSMGGLVSREYNRQTNGKNVHKLITIGTPNHGTYGYIAFGCNKYIPLFHERKYTQECEDMDHNSAFLHRLNSYNEDKLNFMTIAGIATEVDANDALKRDLCPNPPYEHDETICAASVYLENARNERVYGDQVAGTANTFHSDLINPSKVPDVYRYVKNFLK